MAESQNIEYKESWRDEYLKWVCGFANAQGGTIYIGIDDAGKVVGVQNIKKLMEDIPNKIQSGLGIACEVNKLTKEGEDYLEIKVNPSALSDQLSWRIPLPQWQHQAAADWNSPVGVYHGEGRCPLGGCHG